MFDWSGFYVGLGIFVVLSGLALGFAKPVAAQLERVEWHSIGKNQPMY
ncbi:MAG: hypothetical protein M0Z41_12645 [Peptococcaceae bacterium]|jgi:hypothetical protein|nr:hypothetical protein [Peptococcaceae bacterium]